MIVSCGCSRGTESSGRLRVGIPSAAMKAGRGERSSSREPVRVITCSATRSRKLHIVDISVASEASATREALGQGSKARKGELLVGNP